MLICPVCGEHYAEGVTECVNCGVDLVNARPEGVREQGADLVELHTFPGEVYAEMVKEALVKNGIPCVVQGHPMIPASLVRGTTEALPTTIWVHRMDLERAEEIMEGMLDHI